MIKAVNLPLFNGILDPFIGGEANHGGRHRPYQFQTKSSIQSLYNVAIRFLDQGLCGSPNGELLGSGYFSQEMHACVIARRY
jgi:hypothetical protein